MFQEGRVDVAAPVDLGAGGYNVQMFFNGSASAGLTVNLTGSVATALLVFVDVTDSQGKAVRWGGELTSPNRLARMEGAVKWHKTLLKPGDRLTMTGHPARNGAPAMSITKLVAADGAVLIDE